MKDPKRRIRKLRKALKSALLIIRNDAFNQEFHGSKLLAETRMRWVRELNEESGENVLKNL
jgi:hypothetical protein